MAYRLAYLASRLDRQADPLLAALGSGLAKEGGSVHLVSDDPPEVVPPGVEVEEIRGRRVVGSGLPRKVERSLDLFEPDAVLARGLNPWGTAAARARWHPLVILLGASDAAAEYGKVASDRALRTVLGQADLICCETRSLVRSVASLAVTDARLETVPPAVDLDRFSPKTDGGEVRHSYAWDKAFVVALPLHEATQAATESVLRSIRRTLEGNGSVRFLLIGEPTRSLRRLATESVLKDTVSFARVPPRRLPEHLAAADMAFLPAISAGLPPVLLEAMATGLPVVAGACPGAYDWVQGDGGRVVPADSPRDAAEAVLEISRASAAERKAMGVANALLVRRQAGPTAVATRLLRFIRSLPSKEAGEEPAAADVDWEPDGAAGPREPGELEREPPDRRRL